MANIQELLAGYREFYQEYFQDNNDLYNELSTIGQSPKTLVIACSDSRVDPAIITNAEPGDLFVVRNVANLAPTYENDNGTHGVSAALEFAVRILEVEHIVILGHSNCAGIQTLMNPEKMNNTDFIGSWMGIAQPARDKTLVKHPQANTQTLQTCCEKESIILSLENLLTFPWIKAKIDSNQLKLHGWHLSLEDGSLYEYNPDKEKFIALTV